MDNKNTTYTKDVEILVTDWFRRARESQRIHYECGARNGRLNLWLGIPAIALSAIVGSAIFASINIEELSNWWKIIVGGVSILAAVLASLQTFLGFSKKADAHRAAGAEYGAIRRELEELKTFPPETPKEMQKSLTAIRERMDFIAKESPEVPSKLKTKIDKELKSSHYKRIFNLYSPQSENNSSQ